MRILIAEDDATSRKFINKFLSQYGVCDLVIDGLEAIDAVQISLSEDRSYDLICLDIMMPKIDGVKALEYIKMLEAKKGIDEKKRSKIIMTTALAETSMVKKSFELGCDAYVAKPIDTEKLKEVLAELDLIKI